MKSNAWHLETKIKIYHINLELMYKWFNILTCYICDNEVATHFLLNSLQFAYLGIYFFIILSQFMAISINLKDDFMYVIVK